MPMSLPPEIATALPAVRDLFALRTDVAVRHPYRTLGDQPSANDPISLMHEMGGDAYRVVVSVNEAFAMVAAHGRVGLTLPDWCPDFGQYIDHVRVDYPGAPDGSAEWLAAVADRLVPVVDQAAAAVSADREAATR